MCAELLEDLLLHHELVTSVFIPGELGRKLVQQFRFPEREGEQVAAFLRRAVVLVEPAGKPLSWQALYAFNGVPAERLELPGNRYLFGACPARDGGGQAAAIILDDHGIIEAIGFSSFHCCEPHTKLNHRFLDLYVKRGASADTLIADLKSWLTGSIVTAMLSDPHDDDCIDSRITLHVVH